MIGYLEMVKERMEGLEPSAFAMATRRSSQLSYTRLNRCIVSLSVDLCQYS